jgi:hypothetical protein
MVLLKVNYEIENISEENIVEKSIEATTRRDVGSDWG